MKQFSLIILAVISLSFITGSLLASDLTAYQKRGHKSPAWIPLVEAGMDAYDSGNYQAALNFFGQAMAKGCKDGLVYFKLGIYYETVDDLSKAKKYLTLAKKYLPKRYRGHKATKTVHEHLGRVLYSLGEKNAAKKELELARNYQGENFTIMFLLGSIAKDEGNDQKIVEYYSSALKKKPPPGVNPQEILVTLLVEIGKSYYNLREYDKSLTIWNQLLGIQPKHKIARQYKNNIERMKMDQQRKQEEQRIMEQFIQ